MGKPRKTGLVPNYTAVTRHPRVPIDYLNDPVGPLITRSVDYLDPVGRVPSAELLESMVKHDKAPKGRVLRKQREGSAKK